MPNIIIADKSYKLSELAAATTNEATDIFYVVKIVDGEEVAYKITRAQLLSGLAGTLSVENDGTAVGNASTLNFVPGANITFTITDAGSGQINVEIAAGGSGAVAWGAITGTLADQTDLNTVLGNLASGIASNASDISTNASAIAGKLDSVVGGTGISVNNTDPNNPVVSSTVTPGGQVDSVIGTADEIAVDATDPVNPVVSLPSAVTDSLALADSSVQSVVAGTNVTVDATDPANPIVSATPGGTGDVVGPASATDNAIARYDFTTGKLIQNSGVTIDDSDNLSGVNNRTGNDTNFVSGTAGSNGNIAEWNNDGDLIDGNKSANEIVTADSAFGGANKVLKSGVDRKAQPSGIEIDASDNLTGVNNTTGSDTDFVTGTAGTSGNLAQWNADGDVVDSTVVAADVLTVVPAEEEIVGTAIYDATFTGTENLDLSTFTALYGILTGNTTITVTNTPASGESFVRSLKISSTATESLTLPVGWLIVGTYAADGSLNDIQIEFSNFPTQGLVVTAYINQPA